MWFDGGSTEIPLTQAMYEGETQNKCMIPKDIPYWLVAQGTIERFIRTINEYDAKKNSK